MLNFISYITGSFLFLSALISGAERRHKEKTGRFGYFFRKIYPDNEERTQVQQHLADWDKLFRNELKHLQVVQMEFEIIDPKTGKILKTFRLNESLKPLKPEIKSNEISENVIQKLINKYWEKFVEDNHDILVFAVDYSKYVVAFVLWLYLVKYFWIFVEQFQSKKAMEVYTSPYFNSGHFFYENKKINIRVLYLYSFLKIRKKKLKELRVINSKRAARGLKPHLYWTFEEKFLVTSLGPIILYCLYIYY